MYAGGHFTILLIALIADRLIGDPEWLWRRVPHPVVWGGKLIAVFERTFNKSEYSPGNKEKTGLVTIVILLLFAAVIGHWLAVLVDLTGIIGIVVEIAVVTVLIAQKSLADHVRAVADGLRENGLAGGRQAVAKIVGRDPDKLDEYGVTRAAIESLAENASDGVVAPVFWFAVLGLPGLLAYKMLNTADSMIGHKSERYRAFGRATAKLDDLANWLPARLCGLLIVLAVASLESVERAKRAFGVMRRDAPSHRSPNAGWPEAAMAAATGVALGGPRIYAEETVDDPYLNVSGRHTTNEKDIRTALTVFWRTMTILATIAAVLAVAN